MSEGCLYGISRHLCKRVRPLSLKAERYGTLHLGCDACRHVCGATLTGNSCGVLTEAAMLRVQRDAAPVLTGTCHQPLP